MANYEIAEYTFLKYILYTLISKKILHFIAYTKKYLQSHWLRGVQY